MGQGQPDDLSHVFQDVGTSSDPQLPVPIESSTPEPAEASYDNTDEKSKVHNVFKSLIDNASKRHKEFDISKQMPEGVRRSSRSNMGVPPDKLNYSSLG